MHRQDNQDRDERKLRIRRKLMVVTHNQENCANQIFVQVHASSADDTSNKNGRSWTKQITFSILSIDHSMGTQNFYLNNLIMLKK